MFIFNIFICVLFAIMIFLVLPKSTLSIKTTFEFLIPNIIFIHSLPNW